MCEKEKPQELPDNVRLEDGKLRFVGSNRDWCEEHGEDYDRLNAEDEEANEEVKW